MSAPIDLAAMRATARACIDDDGAPIEGWSFVALVPPDEMLALIDAVEAAQAFASGSAIDFEFVYREAGAGAPRRNWARFRDALARFDSGGFS